MIFNNKKLAYTEIRLPAGPLPKIINCGILFKAGELAGRNKFLPRDIQKLYSGVFNVPGS